MTLVSIRPDRLVEESVNVALSALRVPKERTLR